MRILTFGQKFLNNFPEILDELKTYNRGSSTPVRNASPVSTTLEVPTRTRSRSESNGMDTLQVPILVSGLSKSLTDLQDTNQKVLEENQWMKDEIETLKCQAKADEEITNIQQREVSGLSKSLTDLQIVNQNLLEDNQRMKDEIETLKCQAKADEEITNIQQREVSGLSKSLTDLQIVNQNLLEDNQRMKDEIATLKGQAKVSQDASTKINNQQREVKHWITA
ncbi:uncharacterized protein LOC119085653 [Bradysia coprophila]|uniref:uncharacterized protein LOC119085653 n=1 Tax=Bradysia coprophila TaxID=38358 RepID=UPI00187DBE0A|nr:uncharacterized protein LOC119085653 [Bradysia coprophila]